jgi:peptidylprolyl isomerase
MVAGEKRRLWVPESLTFAGKKEPPGTRTFDVELIYLTASPTIPPPDVKAPPPDAKRTPSGLAYKVLTAGTGTRRPGERSTVMVHYSGWTTNGKLFDSSLTRGQPATYTLDDVIPGWTEGLQLMVEGEKVRLWVPQQLAYKGQSAPYGMLVFDIELLQIK